MGLESRRLPDQRWTHIRPPIRTLDLVNLVMLRREIFRSASTTEETVELKADIVGKKEIWGKSDRDVAEDVDPDNQP